MKDQSKVIRTASTPSSQNEHSESLYLTSSYTFDSAEQAFKRFNGEEPGNVYGRFTNPNEQTFSRRLAVLEQMDHCIATATGMGAIITLVLSHLKPGDHIVSGNCLFGTTLGLFSNLLKQYEIDCTFVPLEDTQAWKNAIQNNTRMIFCETPSNPTTALVNLAEVGEIAKQHSILFVVDNCLATPILQQPKKYGADIIIHSATKLIDGQGRCLAGAIVCDDPELHAKHFAMIRTTGNTISPFNAWILSKSLETLELRVKAQSKSALSVAKWLQDQPAVKKVHYCGLETHSQHDLCLTQQNGNGGTLLAFEIHGARQSAWDTINSCQMISISTNIGDTKSMISHSATTSHLRLTDQQKEHAGISESLLRLSIGLESVDDIVNDLARGLPTN